MGAVLIISPHGIDEVLGCGGVMARHLAGGDRVEILILFGDGRGIDAKRRTAGDEAARLLGSQAPRFVGLPENRGDTLPLVRVIAEIERAIAEVAPATLYVPHGGNLNIDHQISFHAALTAARPVPGHAVRAIYSYEVPSSTEWAPPDCYPPFLPNRFVDIGPFIEQKIQALQCYSAEIRPSPHPRSLEGVRTLAKTRGFSVGVAAAEAFAVIREIADSSEKNQ